MPQPTVSSLTVYPVKSCRGIAVEEASLEARGFAHDRRWMIIDDRGTFLSQRELPRLALVDVRQDATSLTLTAPDMQPLRLPLRLTNRPVIQVDIWNDTVGGMLYDEPSDQWISSFLKIPARFVYMPEETYRPVNPKYASRKEQVSFADAFPVLLISEASLGDLNARLTVPLPMNRFRPNIVLSGCSPYEEDTWKRVRIGSVMFQVAKPCDRCATVIVDQKTGIKGEEPLRTLATYREVDGKVMFGQNLLHEGLGTIHVGDPVTIL